MANIVLRESTLPAKPRKNGIGRLRKAGIAAGAVFRLRRPALELSARRIRAGVAGESDIRNMVKSNNPQHIADALVACIPQQKENGSLYRDGAKTSLVRHEELQKQLAERLATRAEASRRSGEYRVVGGTISILALATGALSLLKVVVCDEVTLATGIGLASFGVSWLANRIFTSRRGASVSQKSGELLQLPISDDAKAILAPHAPIGALVSARASASENLDRTLVQQIGKRKAGEAYAMLMSGRPLPERVDEEDLVRNVCEHGTGEQAGNLYRSGKIASRYARQLLGDRLH